MPTSRITSSAVITLLVCSVARAALAADWLSMAGLEFTQRLEITVTNPADVPADSALVQIALADIVHLLPNAKPGQLAVVDPTTQPARREQAANNFVPAQINGGVLTFAIPLKPLQKKQLYLYTSPARANLPGFAARTSFDERHAYRSFENNRMAFRMETGPGANTTGMAIDLFGKTADGEGVRLPEIYDSAHDDYHELQYWGIDCLKIGSSPGLGGVYVVVGEEMGRPDAMTTFVDLVQRGPVQLVIRAAAPVEVAGRKLTVTRTLTLWADERGIDDVVEIRGDNLDDVQIGIGLRNLPGEKWIENLPEGYALNHGQNNQPNYRSVGLGLVFEPTQFSRTIELPDKANGGRVYVMNPRRQGDALISRHHLSAIWDGDGWINNPEDFARYLKHQAARRSGAIKIDFARFAEDRPD